MKIKRYAIATLVLVHEKFYKTDYLDHYHPIKVSVAEPVTQHFGVAKPAINTLRAPTPTVFKGTLTQKSVSTKHMGGCLMPSIMNR
jgi:hypothetical protein